MAGSIQHKLSRVRPPRVQITYDVETGGALEKKEIPFIVGILAPLSGSKNKDLPPLRERKLVQIDRDNFNKVLESINPEVVLNNTPNTVPTEDADAPATRSIKLNFSKLDDFNPVAVLQQISDLDELFQQRSRLRDFLGKMDGNDPLAGMAIASINDDEKKTAINAAVSAEVIAALNEIWKEDFERKNSNAEIKDKEKKEKEKDRKKAILELFKVPPESDDINKLEGPDDIIKEMLVEGKMSLDIDQCSYALELIAEFVIQLVNKTDLIPTAAEDKKKLDVSSVINKRIAKHDKIISRQLNHVIHHKEFQRLEASWRGLNYLVMNTETNTKLKLKLLNVDFEDLYADLDKAVEFDQSALFKKIYEDEYGTYGGEPYSVLIGDFDNLGRGTRDIRFLELISQVAAAAHAPFIASAYAKLFDLEDFSSLHKPRDLSKIFDSAELIKWRAFRESEDSRYVTLTLPRVMARLPYHNEDYPVEGIYFDEVVAVNETDDDGNKVLSTDEDDIEYEKTTHNVDASKILWGSPAYVLGQRITNAFSLYGWTAAIRGVEGGGLVEGLPTYIFETEDGDIALNCPTQVSITDRREKELNDLGFMAICHCKGTDKAAFFGGQTTNKPKQYLTDSASKNAQISAMLPYMLAASRFAHYIKVLMREKLGSFLTRQNVEDYLNTWISQYVLLDDTPPQHIKAQFPLREARIEVTDVKGKVGAYKATVFLRPHFQLEELTTSIRLVAELPS